MLSTYLSRSRTIRTLVLAGCTLALSACSHDRYLFLERADLERLEQLQLQQQQQLEQLEAQTREQLVRLESRQDEHQQTLLQQLSRQQTLLRTLPRQVPPPSPPLPARKASSEYVKGKLIVGEAEPIYIADPGIVYTARIDSGAATSSLHATNIQRFERDGQPWVRFDVSVPGREEALTLEHEISRRARIIQSNTEDPERRIVIELPFVLGSHRGTAEFTLSDRSHLTYPVLVGRNILRDVMLVDVGQEFVTKLPEGLKTEAGVQTP